MTGPLLLGILPSLQGTGAALDQGVHIWAFTLGPSLILIPDELRKLGVGFAEPSQNQTRPKAWGS